jgi:hypothetical protein
MKTTKRTFTSKIAVAALVFAAAVFSSGSAFATPYGTEITINDGITQGTPGVSGNAAAGVGTAKEDNEAEPGMVQSQAWDLEGFFLNGKNLTIVGGYNFYTGKSDGSKVLTAGDIFVDTNGDAVYSPNKITTSGFTYTPYELVNNSYFKYDYVLDVDWSSGKFDIVQLGTTSVLKDTEYGAAYNQASNPWKYDSLGNGTVIRSGLNFNTYNKASQSDTGFDGWSGTDGENNHYVATFDLSAIAFGSGLSGTIFHNTMECGNDNLLGQAAPVPEPGTMMLLGLGMLGMAVYGKRRMNRG